MIRRIIVAPLVLAIAACGPGGPNFTENADVAPAVLYGAFAELPSTGAGLSVLGLHQSAVRSERVNEDTLLLTVPSGEGNKASTFRLQFACRETCDKTELRATIDLPQVRLAGNKELSTEKVVQHFRDDALLLIKAKEQRLSTQPAAREFAGLFDGLRMITNPGIRQQVRSMAAAENGSMPFTDDAPGPPPGFGAGRSAGSGASPASINPNSAAGRQAKYSAWVDAAREDDAAQDENAAGHSEN
jgi:hypothetical protein